MRKIKLTISYDGTNYVGWQIQPNGVSIQGLMQDAVSPIVGSRVSVVAAGRTDAGVHAIAQVAHVAIESGVSADGIRNGANSMLPPDIAIIEALDVDPGFHAMKDASGKLYLYRILISRQRIPLQLNRTWRLNGSLDLNSMRDAASCLIGRHDFESFRASGCTANDAIRMLKQIEMKAASEDPFLHEGQGEIIDIAFEGDGFVRHMIRNIVGTLVEVGKGRITPNHVKSILEKKNRQEAYMCAPACGLYLVKVFYSS